MSIVIKKALPMKNSKVNSIGCSFGVIGFLLLVVYFILFIIDSSIDFWPALICFILMGIGVASMPRSNKKQTSPSLHDPNRLSVNISMTGRESLVFELKGVHLDHNKYFILNFCKEGDIVRLEFEPTNKYDPNAIQIFHGNSAIGYVPMEETDEVNEFISKYNYTAIIYKKYRAPYSDYLTVEIGLIQRHL